MNIRNPETRKYLYKVCIAVILLLQVMRLIPGDYVASIVNVATAVFGIGAPALAIPNTPEGRHEA